MMGIYRKVTTEINVLSFKKSWSVGTVGSKNTTFPNSDSEPDLSGVTESDTSSTMTGEPSMNGTHNRSSTDSSRNRIFACVVISVLIACCSGQTDRCPEKCLCFRTTVRCMFVQLNSIPVVPPHTTILDLRFNKIRSIAPGSFKQLGRLNTLLLNNNHITRLQNGAFDGLSKLRYLYLYKNRIRHIDRDVFQNLEELEQLYLHFNDISSFQAETFSSLPALQRLFLHHNRLQRVPTGAFRNLQALRRLRLDSNALVCDCQLLWLAEMVKQKQDRTLVAATCEQPHLLQGKSIMSLADTEFHCVGMPQIREGPRDVEVRFGGTAAFTCRVDGDPAPEVVWLHNNEVIPEARPRYSVLGDGTLTIHNAQGDDEGFYECRATNKMGEVVSRAARISMQHHQQPNSPAQILEEPSSQNVTAASRLELRCNVTGQPYPEVVWKKEGGGLVLDQRVQVTVSHSLLFTPVRRTDTGVYSCIATNEMATRTASAAIRVYVPVSLNTEPSDVYVSVGGTAQFSCAADGWPTPDLVWLRGTQNITPQPGVSISIGGEAMRLVDVQRGQEGVYTCKASNGAYEAQASATLYIRDTLAPSISPTPLDQTVVLGQPEVTLQCGAHGLPAPTITWTKNGDTMTHSGNVRIGEDGSLSLMNVSSTDAGQYECSVRNDQGYAQARATLTVEGDVTRIGVGDEFFRESFLEANDKVNRALNMTISQLFHRDRPRQALPHELLRVFRFPQTEAREIARAAEKMEQTLAIVYRHVQAGMVFNVTDFRYDDLLSPDNLRLLTNLSGCLAHRRAVTCNDMCFHLKYRTLDGTCNNLDNPMWGSSLTGFRRALPPIYENGFNSPVGWSKTKVYYGYFKPSPRLVSTRILSTDAATPDEECTHMLMQWGQFLDHDMDHALPSISTETFTDGTQCQRSCEYSAPCFPIEIPYDDPRVYRHRCMEFTRSSAVCGSGMTSVFFNTVQPREQINQLTSFIDASQVYGSSYSDTQQLRNFTHNLGELRIGISMPSGKPLMPFSNGAPIDCRRDVGESAIDCFLAGDVRANEQTGLLAMHTIWFREHNRIAGRLRVINPHWDGDTIFHETRKILGSLMQHITYHHWLPHIIGPDAMTKLGPYKGYDSTLEPSISNAFATAAFRFGHSLVNPILHRLNATFQPIRHGHLALHRAFFSPWRLVQEGGVDPILRGLFATPAKLKQAGQFLNSELTEKLFESAHEIALDLAAINIQRGRDHALPGYLEWRHFCKLSIPDNFEDLRYDIRSADVREKLHQLYGHPGNVDIWVGGLLEDALPGARVGPTIACLLTDQFRRLRDADRFWYEHPSVLKPEQLLQIRRMTLGRVLCSNGDDIQDVSKDVFLLPHSQTPSFVPCSTLPELDLRLWAECCKDCRNAGYFNSLIRTPGLRLRRSAEHSYKEDREDMLLQEAQPNVLHSGISSEGIFYGNMSRKSEVNIDYPFENVYQEDNYKELTEEKLRISSEMEILLKIGEENNHMVGSQHHYGFDYDGNPSSGVVSSTHTDIKVPHGAVFKRSSLPSNFEEIIPEEPVSAFNRGLPSHAIPGGVGNLRLQVGDMQNQMNKLTHTVNTLKDMVVELQASLTAVQGRRRASRRGQHQCTDAAGGVRALRETWQQEDCTQCVCRRKGVRCRQIRCPPNQCDSAARLTSQQQTCCAPCQHP